MSYAGSTRGRYPFVEMVGSTIRRYPIVVMIVACALVFAPTSSAFFTAENLTNVLLQISVIGIMSVGMTFILVSGNFDLSVGSILGLAAAIAMGMQSLGLGAVVAVLIALMIGTLLGTINGLLVTKAKINSFIVTLGAMIGVRGLVYLYTNERPIVGTDRLIVDFGNSSIGPIPTLGVIFLVALIIGEFVLRYTTHGRNTTAVGSNPEASINAGISVDRHLIVNFMLSGFMAALAGVLLVARTNSATAFLGSNYEMLVISAVVLGGTRLMGGYGSMIHTLGGVLVIGAIQNGMSLLNVHTYYSMLVMGLLLIFTVFVNTKWQRQ